MVGDPLRPEAEAAEQPGAQVAADVPASEPASEAEAVRRRCLERRMAEIANLVTALLFEYDLLSHELARERGGAPAPPGNLLQFPRVWRPPVI